MIILTVSADFPSEFPSVQLQTVLAVNVLSKSRLSYAFMSKGNLIFIINLDFLFLFYANFRAWMTAELAFFKYMNVIFLLHNANSEHSYDGDC